MIDLVPRVHLDRYRSPVGGHRQWGLSVLVGRLLVIFNVTRLDPGEVEDWT